MKEIAINTSTPYACEKKINETIDQQASTGFKVDKITVVAEAQIVLYFEPTTEKIPRRIELICGPRKTVERNTLKYLEMLLGQEKEMCVQKLHEVRQDRWYGVILHEK